MEAPIKLLIPFESLLKAIAALDLDDQIRLHHLLGQHINKPEETREMFLTERGCQLPLKEGLPLTSEPVHSGQSNISIDHDYLVTQQFKEDH